MRPRSRTVSLMACTMPGEIPAWIFDLATSIGLLTQTEIAPPVPPARKETHAGAARSSCGR